MSMHGIDELIFKRDFISPIAAMASLAILPYIWPGDGINIFGFEMAAKNAALFVTACIGLLIWLRLASRPAFFIWNHITPIKRQNQIEYGIIYWILSGIFLTPIVYIGSAAEGHMGFAMPMWIMGAILPATLWRLLLNTRISRAIEWTKSKKYSPRI